MNVHLLQLGSFPAHWTPLVSHSWASEEVIMVFILLDLLNIFKKRIYYNHYNYNEILHWFYLNQMMRFVLDPSVTGKAPWRASPRCITAHPFLERFDCQNLGISWKALIVKILEETCAPPQVPFRSPPPRNRVHPRCARWSRTRLSSPVPYSVNKIFVLFRQKCKEAKDKRVGWSENIKVAICKKQRKILNHVPTALVSEQFSE